jgi:hypothetical protein
MRSAQYWKRNTKTGEATEKEKSWIVGIAIALLLIFALIIVAFGLEPINDDEPVCQQAAFMHGGTVTKGQCQR